MLNKLPTIPKNLLDRSRVVEALTFISEQNIPTPMKVFLLIQYGRSINKEFSLAQIDFALRDHTATDVSQE